MTVATTDPTLGDVVLVSSMDLHAQDGKALELRVALHDVASRAMALPGCIGCRLLTAVADGRALTLVHDWSGREALDRYLGSDDYRVLIGMRYLLDGEPHLGVDEVVAVVQRPAERRTG